MIDPISWPPYTNADMKADIIAGKVNEIIAELNKSAVPNREEAPESPVSHENCLHESFYVLNAKTGLHKCRDCKKVWKV